MDFKTGRELLELCKEHEMSISEVMMQRETDLTEVSRDDIYARMEKALSIMRESSHKPLTEPVKSIGGLIGGEAEKLEKRRLSGASICGNVLAKAITYAMAVLEVNTSMGLIVAAPTAGSSGIVPGLLLSLQEEYNLTDEEVIHALFTASAVGYLAMRNATVAGAVGGCQAEVGVASAMAAASAVELMGGTPKQCLNAASTAIMNLLGLVCDPIGGLVECPCQSRNAVGTANALTCAEIALSGIGQLIPLDEMLDTMLNVGRGLPYELRETALGGCAATATGCTLGCCSLNA
ncbi:L-serine ammonia-lyase, iron-sulfur-dependent, subunit alpha [Clostridium sp. chh4-2]|uniref:L-serine ammonia-lyase, iron-sulfur-dependent, subunit alpha n=1 Tax=Clostridium sp. chh4-2 TaxID=2067550 RepID=UPI000CCEA8AB|nr:L-serine ammonia-lyase, iron-sulfur-dependent, subunit alpha [Clostridium sp. chh4-2]PNV61274.1 L-serine ammonia-lyase, iron-sulfur-dependent, subunit alpha [Clostridium sp. chh4-2]